MQVPYLINPARRKRKSSGARKRKGGGLPGALLKRMIRTYGRARGMKEAWKEYRGGARNPRKKLPPAYHIRSHRHRPVVYSGVHKGSYVRSPYSRSPSINPFGEEVLLVGNPRRRKKVTRRRRRHVYRANPIRRRRSYALAPRRRRRHVYRMRHNPVIHRRRHSRRRYRRNPASSGALAISMRRPMSLLMPAAAGTAGYFAADYIPSAIGMAGTPMTRIGVKAGIAFAGSMVLSRFIGAKNASFFSVGVGINMLNDVLRTYVFKTGVTAGFGAFGPSLNRRSLSGMGAMVNPYSNTGMSPYARS